MFDEIKLINNNTDDIIVAYPLFSISKAIVNEILSAKI